MKKHIVMVPGFCGFDGLGDLNYYAGTMEVFERFRAASAEPVALHYFDNFPTASVAVRANRLRLFLVKMMQRGAIQPGEPIALVGHSTGGLDIRKLLWDLARTEKAKGDPQAQQQEPDLLGAIRRVVLLSVPHCGSHLGDAVGGRRRRARA